jgi:hypothetical protein
MSSHHEERMAERGAGDVTKGSKAGQEKGGGLILQAKTAVGSRLSGMLFFLFLSKERDRPGTRPIAKTKPAGGRVSSAVLERASFSPSVAFSAITGW